MAKVIEGQGELEIEQEGTITTEETTVETTETTGEETTAETTGEDTTTETTAETPAEEVTTVTIGDEKPAEEEQAPGWVKEVRKRNRELEKQNRELQRQIQGQSQVPAVGKKPEMGDPDIDYDAEKFEKKYAEWTERKRQAEAEQAKLEEQQKTEQTQWQAKLDSYGTQKAALKVPGIDEAETLVQETLSEKQQAIIIKGAKNPALLFYALGRNPAKLQELAKMGDLVEFAFAVANVEGQLKVTTKKPAPPAPEKTVSGAAPNSGAMDNTLDKLRADAERTGDYSKVHAYKKQKKAA